MKPILFSIGPLDISSYYFMGMIGLLGGFFFNYWETKRRNLDVKLSIYGAVWVSIFGYIGARAMHIVFDGFLEIYIQKPLAILAFWKGGLAFYGTVIFGLPAALWWFRYHKAPFLKYLDNYTYGIAFGVGIGRIGCYLNGCCFGEISSSSIASQFIKYGLSAKNQFARDILPDLKEMPFPVFPAQLISFLANMVIFLFLWIFVRKRYKKDGSVFGIWMIMYGIFRFIIEIFRADDRGLFFNDLFSSSQIIAIISVIAGILIIKLPDKEEKSVSHSQS
jgi:phosphatidylglycerol---prolipoprotein diacylglyceryl transferase